MKIVTCFAVMGLLSLTILIFLACWYLNVGKLMSEECFVCIEFVLVVTFLLSGILVCINDD